MKIRFEVARSRSYYWPWFVKRAKKSGSYRVVGTSHIVTLDNTADAIQVWAVIRSWKGVVVAVNDEPMSSMRFNWIMWKIEMQPVRTAAMLQGVIDRAAKRRDFGEDEGRWRMGMGPDPRA